MDLTGYVAGMIGFEGEGTNVVPNPTGTPTDELESVQIGDVIYNVGGGGESIVPTPTNVDRGKYLGVKSNTNELEYRSINELPSSEGASAGTVLTHTISGDSWLPPATELPAYSTAQNNKVLGVHNGELEWVAQSGGGVNYSTNEQKIGTWIDNSPIYQKTFSPLNTMQLEANTWNEVPYVDIPNGNTCIKTEVYLGGGENSQSTFFGRFENGAFYIFSTISLTISLVTVQYTKESSS